MSFVNKQILARVSQSFGANAFGQAVTVALQFVQIPLFLHYWEKGYYGEWLVLSAFPSFMNLADAGLGTAASNEAAMLCGGGKSEEAQQVISNSWTMQVRLLGVLALLSPLVFMILSPLHWLNLHGITFWDAILAATFLAWTVLLTIPNSLLMGLYRAEGKNARGTMLLNIARVVGFPTTVIALGCGAKIMELAAVGFAFQAITLTWLVWDSRLQCTLRLKSGRFCWREFKQLIAPALGFQLFPVGNALYFQGQTLLVNFSLGPQQVVVFNSLRTLSRVIAQIAALIKHSAWPEFSLLRHHPDAARLRRLTAVTTGLCGTVAAGAAIGIVIVGPWVLHYWTHGQVVASRSLIAFFALPAMLNAVWAIPAGLLQAINKHMLLAWAYCGSCLLGVLVSWILSPMGFPGMVYGMVSAELAMVIAAGWLAFRLLRQLSIGPVQPRPLTVKQITV